MKYILYKIRVGFVFFLICSKGLALERGINIQAFFKRPDGTAVNQAAVTVNLKVVSPNNCILMDEDHSNISVTGGFLYVVLGKGTRTATDNGLSLSDVLNNRTATNGLDTLNGGHANCNYMPVSTDSRKLQISFSDSGTAVVASFNIRASGYAVRADEAETVQGVGANQILQTNVTVTQAKINQLVDHILAPIAAAGVGSGFTWNGTDLVVYDPSNGALLASNTVQPSSIVSLPYSKLTSVPASLSTIAGLSCASGEVMKFNGSAWACAADATGAGAVSSVAGRTGAVTLTSADLSDFNSVVDTRADARISAASFDASKITSGTLTVPVSASSVSANVGQFTTLKIYDGSANYLTQSAPTGGFGGSGYTVRWPANVGTANQVLQISSVNSGVANLDWTNPSASGLTNLNGASGSTQSFAVGTSGTAPNFSTASNTHTLNLPLASVAGVTSGLISKTDYDTFNGKLDSTLASAKVFVGNGSNVATGVNLSGDVSITNAGAVTVNGLKGKTISAAPTLAGQVLRYDGTNFAPAAIAMTDLRSSVTGTSAFPTACTSSQTLTYNSVGDTMNCETIMIGGSNFSSQTANTFFAAPNGNSGSPGFRAIAAADLPSGVVSASTYRSVTVDTYGRVTAGTNPSTIAEYGITDVIANGSQPGAVSLGSSNANSLTFKTTNTAQMTILSSGNVGIGTTSPGAKLEIYGTSGVTLKIVDGNQAAGKVLTSNASGQASWASASGFAGSVNITTTPYTITSSQDGIYFTYTYAGAGVINLPAISSLSDGFQVTILRQVAQSLTLTPNGTDAFPNGNSSIEMQSSNMASVTLTMLGAKWNVTNSTDDCIVGQSCWGTNNLYIGIFMGHQYFTTPGGCTDSNTPTCAGGNDTVTKAWASNSGTTAYNVSTGASDYNYGYNNSVTLATNYTDTDAAKYCRNMNYAGYTDWYLPATQELLFLYRLPLGAFGLLLGAYWSSREIGTTYAQYLDFSLGHPASNDRASPKYVRCVRRF